MKSSYNIKDKEFLLINDPVPHNGFFNMDFDVWLFELIKREEIKNIIRFYEWENPTITYGKFQNIEKDINISLCNKDQIDLVKRPTGGRAILHYDEVTFTFLFPSKTLHPFTFRNTFILAGELLKAGFDLLDIQAQINIRSEKYQNKGICFQSTAQYELLDQQGEKLAGIAQYFTQEAVLIQGSIPLSIHPGYEKYFKRNTSFQLNNQLIKSKIKKDQLRQKLINGIKKKHTTLSFF